MTVIKHSETNRQYARPGLLDLGDIRRQGEQFLEQARAEAVRIVAEARLEAQTLIDSAAEFGHAEGHGKGVIEGRAEGEREGRAQAAAEHAERIGGVADAWRQALDRWDADRSAMLMAAREDVLALALAIAARVTHKTIEADPTVVGDQLAEALALVVAPSRLTVAVHPDDRELVSSVLAGLVERLGTATHAALVEDASIGRGGCLVSTGRGRVDATIETQLERIAAALAGRPAARRPPETPGAGAGDAEP